MIIYKYYLKVTDIQTILMPKGAEILSAGIQANNICIWASVNPEIELEGRVFQIIGIGHGEYEPRLTEFIGTVFASAYVWHIFEVVK